MSPPSLLNLHFGTYLLDLLMILVRAEREDINPFISVIGDRQIVQTEWNDKKGLKIKSICCFEQRNGVCDPTLGCIIQLSPANAAAVDQSPGIAGTAGVFVLIGNYSDCDRTYWDLKWSRQTMKDECCYWYRVHQWRGVVLLAVLPANVFEF